MSAIQESIQEVYIGLLGRAADLEGLTYWEGQINSGFTIEDLRENIINSQTEYAEGLGLLSRGELVEALYDNMFGRTPDLEGYAYWTAGEGAAVADDDMVTTLVNAAQGSDVTILDNKATAANYFTNNAPDSTDTTAAASAIANVDETAASVTAAQATVDSLGNQAPTITATATASGDEDTAIVITAPVVADEDDDTVTLTAEATNGTVALADDGTATFTPTADFNGEAVVTFTATDAAGATATATTTVTVNAVDESITMETGTETVTGSADADQISAVVSALSSAKTLDVTDTINGGDGSDTFVATMQSAFAGFSTGSMTNVETVELSNTSSIARDFDTSGITGVETYDLDMSGKAINLTDLESSDSVILMSDLASGSVSVAYASGATTTTGQALTLSGMGDEDNVIALTLPTVDAATVTLSGDNYTDFTAAAVETLTLVGDGSLTSATGPAAMTVLDAGEATGAIDFNASASASATSATFGSGDDVLRMVQGNDFLANATLTGGEGTDELHLDGTAAATTQFTQTGFETVTIDGMTAGNLIMSLVNTTGIETINIEDDTDRSATFAGFGSEDITINLKGVNDNGNNAVASLDNSGAVVIK